MIFSCCDQLRRNAVEKHPTLNAIDYLEVLDRDAPPGMLPQRTLLIHCLKAVPALSRDNVRIAGGERVRNIAIVWAAPANAVPVALATPQERSFLAGLPSADHALAVRTDSDGDFSSYRLSLVRSALDPRPPADFDPMLSQIEFSFKVDCSSNFDCKPAIECPVPERPSPEINYLAKDYASFRNLLLDRMTQLMPTWRERGAADFLVTLAEMIAYVGDHLSYQQDAVATEAYLGTARRRVSLRRHALLVDYPMHDGCNARAWMHVAVSLPLVQLTANATQFLTRCEGAQPVVAPGTRELVEAMLQSPEIFAPLHDAVLRAEHNEINFYAWGDRRCCLPRGATRATLRGHFPHLRATDPPGSASRRSGDILLFEEVKGPLTGAAADANPAHRHLVRLTAVECLAQGGPLTDPLTGDQITEIAWDEVDALPFALCVSEQSQDAEGQTVEIDDVSLARGNMVLADHGRAVTGEDLGVVPAARLRRISPQHGDRCAPTTPDLVPARYRPQVKQFPVTQIGTVWVDEGPLGTSKKVRHSFDPWAPAAAAMAWRMADVVPAIALTDNSLLPWAPRRELLSSAADAREFVVEVEADDSATIRFGDDQHGVRPKELTAFSAAYRVGNGAAGNVGADSVVHIVTSEGGIDRVRNPLAGAGGQEKEDAETVRRRAPEAFRIQERAVTPADYASVTERRRGVQRAAATLRWTGSWYTVFVAVDQQGGAQLTPAARTELTRHVDRYRMAGHDLEFNDPKFVSLEIGLTVCVKPDYFRSHMHSALMRALGSRVLPDGRRGLFHPDEQSFGQTIHLSRIYAAAHAVPGVASVVVTKFQQQGQDTKQHLAAGRIMLGRLEISRLDNDPNFPEHGVLDITLFGGK
jgi:hypothetical protein